MVRAYAARNCHSVIERTDGIPLFIEELTKTLIEGGLLRRQRRPLCPHRSIAVAGNSIEPARLVDGAARSAQFGEGCRADRRRDRARIFIRIAEIGCHYSGQPVARCPGPANQCRFGVPSGRPAASGLHLQTCACSGRCLQYPLRGQRQELHAELARHWRMLFPETVATQPEILAHHYTQAGLLERLLITGMSGRKGPPALCQLEAATHLNRGIQLTRSLPSGPERDRRELRLYLCPRPHYAGDQGQCGHELLEVYSRARELLTDDASVREQMNVLYGLWIIHFSRSEHAAAHALAQDCSRDPCGTRTDFPALAHSLMGNALWATGDSLEAKYHLDRSLALCSSEHLSTAASRACP